MATLKKPSLKESDLCFISNANIIKTTILEKLLDNILPSKCHNPDSKSYNDAQIRAVDRAGSAPVPAVGDQLSGKCFTFESCVHSQWTLVIELRLST